MILTAFNLTAKRALTRNVLIEDGGKRCPQPGKQIQLGGAAAEPDKGTDGLEVVVIESGVAGVLLDDVCDGDEMVQDALGAAVKNGILHDDQDPHDAAHKELVLLQLGR